MTGLTRDVSSRWRPLPPSTYRAVIMSAPCAEHRRPSEFRHALVALNPVPQVEVGASGGGGVRGRGDRGDRGDMDDRGQG